MSTPTPDDDQPLREALQHDAARVPEPAFDAALHHATMRRVRALAETESTAPRLRLAPWLAAAAAVLVLGALVALWPPHAPTPPALHEAAPFIAKQTVVPRASLLTYQAAANDSDAALLALLDHDAITLLPASSPIFNAPTLP